MGWTYAFLILCEPESFHGCYSSSNSPGGFSHSTHFNRAVNEWLCIGEVGVDLELCVHAHGHDVDPIMEASCNDNYFLDIISSGICELILCKRGSDHTFSLIPFLGQIKSLVFCRSIRLPNLYYDLPLSITPGISRISFHCTTSYKLWWSTTLPCLCHFMGSGLFVNREHYIVNQVRSPIQ